MHVDQIRRNPHTEQRQGDHDAAQLHYETCWIAFCRSLYEGGPTIGCAAPLGPSTVIEGVAVKPRAEAAFWSAWTWASRAGFLLSVCHLAKFRPGTWRA